MSPIVFSPTSFKLPLLTVAFALVALAPSFAGPDTAAGGQPRIWTSKDGRTLEARGLHVTPSAVVVLRPEQIEPLEIPFSSLQETDIRWAVGNLPVKVNDDVRVAARTVQQSREVTQRETGRYAVSVVGTIRYGTGVFDAIGIVRPITERVTESGRVVEVTLSSLSGDGVAAVEFYTIQGSGNRRRVHSIQTGIFEFSRTGSAIRIPTDVVEDFSGWAVVARSVNDGRVMDIVGSLQPIAEHVRRTAPQTVEFATDTAALRRHILDRLNLE